MSLSVVYPEYVHINLHENNLLPVIVLFFLYITLHEKDCGLLTSSRQGTA